MKTIRRLIIDRSTNESFGVYIIYLFRFDYFVSSDHFSNTLWVTAEF